MVIRAHSVTRKDNPPTPSKQMMFVVTAYHGSGHGDSSTIFLVTPDFADALAIVGNDDLGYHAKFSSDEHGFSIDLLEVGKPYPRQAFKSNDGSPVPNDYPHIVFFRWLGDHLQAEWRPSVARRLGITLPAEHLRGGRRIPES